MLAFGLQMELLARAPFSAVGVVHIANRITQHRPLRLGEELALSVRVSELRPHRRGRAFDFLTAVARRRRAGVGERVDQPQARRRRRVACATRWTFEDVPVTAEWRLRDDLGRRYAAVSGDHNPIHLHA